MDFDDGYIRCSLQDNLTLGLIEHFYQRYYQVKTQYVYLSARKLLLLL